MKRFAIKNVVVICFCKVFLTLKFNIVVGKKLCDHLGLESICNLFMH